MDFNQDTHTHDQAHKHSPLNTNTDSSPLHLAIQSQGNWNHLWNLTCFSSRHLTDLHGCNVCTSGTSEGLICHCLVFDTELFSATSHLEASRSLVNRPAVEASVSHKWATCDLGAESSEEGKMCKIRQKRKNMFGYCLVWFTGSDVDSTQTPILIYRPSSSLSLNMATLCDLLFITSQRCVRVFIPITL